MNAHESSPSILIVDDEAANRFLLDNILAPTYNVLSAKNGTEALELAVIFIYTKTFAQDEDRGLTLGSNKKNEFTTAL